VAGGSVVRTPRGGNVGFGVTGGGVIGADIAVGGVVVAGVAAGVSSSVLVSLL